MKIIEILSNNRENAINIAFILLIPTLIFSIIGLLNIQYYVFEIITSLSFQFFSAAMIYLAITLLAFQYKYKYFYANIIMCLLITVINAGSIIPLYFHSNVSQSENQIKVLMSNVLKYNKDKNAALKVFRKEGADIIITLEIDNEWEKALHKLDNLYPYSYFATRPDCFGIAIQSKLPLSSSETLSFTEFHLPSIKTNVIIEGNPVTIIATHPLPPGDNKRIKLRNEQLKKISELINNEKGKVILAGDLNTTMFSSIYKKLIAETNLIDSRNGFGFLPTFPQGAAILIKVPIDYILYKGFNTFKTYTIEVNGSDHNGIVSILNLNPEH